MTTINRRVIAMYKTWYQPNVYMTREEWLYILYLAVSWNISVGLGIIIGFLIC